jgi:hypothetical protein
MYLTIVRNNYTIFCYFKWLFIRDKESSDLVKESILAKSFFAFISSGLLFFALNTLNASKEKNVTMNTILKPMIVIILILFFLTDSATLTKISGGQ